MAITHSLRILSGFIPRDTAHFPYTHTCVPTKNSERPLADTILIVHLYTYNTSNSLPHTTKAGDFKPIHFSYE